MFGVDPYLDVSLFDVDFKFLNIGRCTFYTMHYHSPGSDTAVALAEFVLSE